MYFVKNKIIIKVGKDIVELKEKIYLNKIKHCGLTQKQNCTTIKNYNLKTKGMILITNGIICILNVENWNEILDCGYSLL